MLRLKTNYSNFSLSGMINYKRKYLLKLLYIGIAICIFLITLNWDIKWITIPIGMLALLVIVYNLNMISDLAERQIQEARNQEEQNESFLTDAPKEPSSTLKQRLTYHGMMILFIILLMPITITGKLVENYLEWKPYIIDLFIFGGTIGFIVSWVYHKKFKVIFPDKEKEYYITAWSFLIPLLIIFHATAWYNKLQPSQVIGKEKVIVNRKGVNYLHDNRYIFLPINNKSIRFEISKKLFSKIEDKDTLMLTIKKGALNYSFVEDFEIMKPVK